MKKIIISNFYLRHWAAIATLLFSVLAFSSSIAQTDVNTDSLKKSLGVQRVDSQRANILVSLASALPCEDTVDKLKYANEASALAKKIQWFPEIIKANIAAGYVYVNCIYNYGNALEYFFIANDAAKAANDINDQASSLQSIAFCYHKMGQYKQAIDYYRQELTLDQSIDLETGIWGNLGVEYQNIGDYNRSINAFYNSLKSLIQIQRTKKIHDVTDTMQMAGLLLDIGDVYLAMSQPDKALENYDSAYKMGVNIKSNIIQILGLINIGQTYRKKHDYGKSIALYQTALKKCKEENDVADEERILNELANVYLAAGDLPHAIDYAQSSLALAGKNSNNDYLSKVYITMGQVLLKKNDYNNAVNYLQKGLDIAYASGALEDEKEALSTLSNAYEQMNEPAKAFDAYRHFISIRDSVYNIDKANEFIRQELDFNYKNKELADKLAYDKKIARQQVLTYSGFTALILVLLLVFFVYRNYETQRKYNALLSKEKKRHLAHIEAQDHVLTDIANIQSHEVRGPVATILGLIQLYNYKDPADPGNKEIIEGLGEVAQELDRVVKKVIIMENNLKKEQSDEDKSAV